MKYLAIDYGTKRVGIATSDDEGRMAFPFRVIPNNKKLIEAIAEICRGERIGTIVVGESHNFSGKPNPIMRSIVPFTEALKKETGLPLEFMNEVYSSQEAARITGDNSENDAAAAALVLQSYLDRAHPPTATAFDEAEV
jgi:putative Holliday junction resolvase